MAKKNSDGGSVAKVDFVWENRGAPVGDKRHSNGVKHFDFQFSNFD